MNCKNCPDKSDCEFMNHVVYCPGNDREEEEREHTIGIWVLSILLIVAAIIILAVK